MKRRSSGPPDHSSRLDLYCLQLQPAALHRCHHDTTDESFAPRAVCPAGSLKAARESGAPLAVKKKKRGPGSETTPLGAGPGPGMDVT